MSSREERRRIDSDHTIDSDRIGARKRCGEHGTPRTRGFLARDNARLKSEKVRRNDVIRKQGIASRRLQSELGTNKRHLSLADAAKKALKKQVTAEQVKNNGLNLKLQAKNAELVTTNATLTGFKRRFNEISVLASQHATR